MTVDGQPVVTWTAALEKILGPGIYHDSESDMSGHVLSPGESMTVFTPRHPENNPLVSDKSDPLWVRDEQRPQTYRGRDLLWLDPR